MKIIYILALSFIMLLLSACGGGGSDPTPCTDTSWSPDTNTQQNGVQFTQNSNCGNTRTNTGTMAVVSFEATFTISFDATQSINLNLLKTQVIPSFNTFNLISAPNLGTITLGDSTLTYLPYANNSTDTLSFDTTGSGNADMFVNMRINNGDPLFDFQWYIRNSRSYIMGDINAQNTLAQGYSGKGVNVAIIEAGGLADNNHEDLNINETYDPFSNGILEHATSVAGIIAGIGYNGVGIRGIAYGSTLNSYNRNGVTPANFQATLGSSTLNPNSAQNDVFNMSFQIKGVTGYPLNAVFRHGVTNLREGKGALYIEGATNDGDFDYHGIDDGYIAFNNYTMGVSALSPITNKKTTYSSVGNQLWVTAYSAHGSNNYDLHLSGLGRTHITTTKNATDNYHRMSGTSASAPIISGAVALLLEVNPSLTWRAVKHIIATTARVVHSDIARATHSFSNGVVLERRSAWQTNGAGFNFHPWYGFGLIDVDSAAEMAKTYPTTSQYMALNNSNYIDLSVNDNSDNPVGLNWHASETISASLLIPQTSIGVSRTLTISEDINIESLEIFWAINSSILTNIIMAKLISPNGTYALIEVIESGDSGRYALSNFFGESSAGVWTIVLHNIEVRNRYLNSWGIRFNGTKNANSNN